MYFNGRFDPVRDALTGSWGALTDQENSSGSMEFRRTLPRYLIVYPSIKELSDNKPRIAAVEMTYVENRWSWSYFSKRRDNCETVIFVTTRSLFFGTPPGERDVQHMRMLASTFPESTTYAHTLGCIREPGLNVVNNQLAMLTLVEGMRGATHVMDAWRCSAIPSRLREQEYGGLQRTGSLLRTGVYRRAYNKHQDLEGAHEPNHKVVKVRTAVLERQHGRAHTAAHKAFERVEPRCKKMVEVSKWPEKEKARLNAKNVFSPRSPNVYPADGLSTPDSALVLKAI
jgi:hypothetical protein